MKKIEVYLGNPKSGKTLGMLLDVMEKYHNGNHISIISLELSLYKMIDLVSHLCNDFFKCEIPKINEFYIYDFSNLSDLKLNFKMYIHDCIKNSKTKLIYIDAFHILNYSEIELKYLCKLLEDNDKTLFVNMNDSEDLNLSFDYKHPYYDLYQIISSSQNNQ